MVEMLSHTDKTVEQLADGIPVYCSTPEIKFTASDDIKFQVVEKIGEYAKSKEYSYLDIDGIKVLFDDGWALVRASNTGPNITVRFEAKTEEKLEKLKEEFIGVLNQFL